MSGRGLATLARAGWTLLRHADFRLLVLALTIVIGCWAFIGLASEVKEGDHQALDERLVRSLRSAADPAVPIGPAWLAEAGRDVTALGSVVVLSLVSLSVAGFLACQRRYRHLLAMTIAVGGGILASTALKHAFMRPRPDVVPHLAYVQTWSFPSGHAMLSAIVYLTLGAMIVRLNPDRRIKIYVLGIAMLLTVLVGISRVFLGVHYPSDVIAGWAAGLTWASGCWLFEEVIARRKREKGPPPVPMT